MTTATSITVRVALTVRRRPGRKTVVTPTTDSVAPVTSRADPALVKALARAFRYQRMLDEGRYTSITEMAAAEGIERGYLGSLLRLKLLAPDIVQAIVDGRQKPESGLLVLLEPMSVQWTTQREVLGLQDLRGLAFSGQQTAPRHSRFHDAARKRTGMPP